VALSQDLALKGARREHPPYHQGERVVGVDGSLSSELALHWAVKEAARRGQQLHVAHALETELVVRQEFALGPRTPRQATIPS